MAKLKIVRFFAVLLLSVLFLSYLANSVSKFSSGDTGVAVQVLTRTRFNFPVVGVCGDVPQFRGDILH